MRAWRKPELWLTTTIPVVPITITLGTQVEALAKYAGRASFADLSVQSRRQLPVHILDSLGCCIE
jgi:hypothetical protein